MKLTIKLFYKGLTFYLTSTNNNECTYVSLDELNPKTIITAPCDYDGALVAKIDETFREDPDDDMIRYFDSITGKEEDDTMTCPHCHQETETAEYLEGENGHESAQMCVNEECSHYGEFVI